MQFIASGLTQDQLKDKNTITRKLVIDKIPGAKTIGKTKGFMKAVMTKTQSKFYHLLC